ncbi:MAG: hypothetical protein AB7I35_01280 [Ramlibacter sp.]
MSILAQIVIALAIFAGGLATGIKWHAGQDARAELAARELRETDARQQRRINDQAAARQAAQLATINHQLGDARVQIASLSGRPCLDPDTVGLLNAIGEQPMRATAGDSAGAPQAVAPGASHGSGLRITTDTDAAGAIALCRARYAEVAGQLGEILDIEDARHPVGRSAPTETWD